MGDTHNMAHAIYNDGCCRCCGGELGKELLSHSLPDRFELACGIDKAGYERRWLECANCGAASNIQLEANYAKLASMAGSYYEVDYAGGDISTKYNWVMGLEDGRSDNASRVDRVLSFFASWDDVWLTQRPLKIMDVGAGTGVFLSKLLRKCEDSLEAVAVEPDPNAAKHLRSLNEFEVVEGLFTGQSNLVNFNFVSLNKVLEHVPMPQELLQKVVNALIPDASGVYVEVPDVKTTKLREPEDNILGALHCHLYTPRSLELLFEAVGLVNVCSGRVFDPSGKLTVYAFGVHPNTYLRKAVT